MDDFKLHLYHDDYHLMRIGQCKDGILFWITSGLVSSDEGITDYICTYKFMPDGRFIGCRIDTVGLRSATSEARSAEFLQDHITRLGEHKFGDIQIYPFSIHHDGHLFGAVVRTGVNDADGSPVVDLLPGHMLMFYEPWEEGLYDT